MKYGGDETVVQEMHIGEKWAKLGDVWIQSPLLRTTRGTKKDMGGPMWQYR